MREEKRTRWYRWSCDLVDCDVTDTSHPAIEDPDPPSGWVTIEPPRFWRGPSLSFCSADHRNKWAQLTIGPLLLGEGR